MSRCKACDFPLTSSDLRRPEPDTGFCTMCISASNKEFNATDIEYDHGSVSGILLDGSTLYVDNGVLDEVENTETIENNENKA